MYALADSEPEQLGTFKKDALNNGMTPKGHTFDLEQKLRSPDDRLVESMPEPFYDMGGAGGGMNQQPAYDMGSASEGLYQEPVAYTLASGASMGTAADSLYETAEASTVAKPALYDVPMDDDSEYLKIGQLDKDDGMGGIVQIVDNDFV